MNPELITEYLHPTVHPVYIRLLCAQLKQRGVDARALLKAAGLNPPEETTAPTEGQFLAFEPVRRFIRLAMDASTCPWLGLETPSVTRVSSHGVVGYAVMASATVAQALRTVSRFGTLRGRLVTYRYHESGDLLHLELHERFDYRDIREYLLSTMVLGLVDILDNLGVDLSLARIQLPYPTPEWEGEYRRRLPTVNLEFGQTDVTRLTLPQQVGRQTSLTADADAFLMAARECERLLAMGEREQSLGAWIRRHLMEQDQSYPTLEEVSQSLHLSTRTVIRRLKSEGLTWQQILDDVRQNVACWYLVNTQVTVEWVAQRAGYEDASNFSRTFRRWTGVTPGDYRREHQALYGAVNDTPDYPGS